MEKKTLIVATLDYASLFPNLHCSIQRFNPVEVYATYKSMVNKHIKNGDNLMISVLIFGRKFEISIILSI